jgi:uncharacterized protein YjbJ (UPF0337 family)
VSKHFDGAIRRRADDNKDASHTLSGAGGVLFCRFMPFRNAMIDNRERAENRRNRSRPTPFFLARLTQEMRNMVNKDQVAGVAKQVKGSVKEAAGKATGNKRTQAEGTAEKVAGKVQKAYGDVKENVKKAL